MNTNEMLIAAARDGDVAAVLEALKRGANVHAEDDLAMCWAARNGHTETVKLLLEHGADVHALDDTAPMPGGWERKNVHQCFQLDALGRFFAVDGVRLPGQEKAGNCS